MKEANSTPIRVGTVLQDKRTGNRVEVIGMSGKSYSRKYAVQHLPELTADRLNAWHLDNFWVIPAAELNKEARTLALATYQTGAGCRVQVFRDGYGKPPHIENVMILTVKPCGWQSGGKPAAILFVIDTHGDTFWTDSSQIEVTR